MQERLEQQQGIQKVQPVIYFVIFMMMILVQISIDQYIPSLPAITKAFKSTESSIQFTLFLFMFGLGISHIFFGPWSDKIGRRRPLIYGIGISVIGCLFCLFAPSVMVLTLGRFLQGFGIGSCSSVGRSLIRDLFADKYLSKIGSYVGVVSTFLLVASPIWGGFIQEHFGWRANFLFIFIVGFVFWFFILWALPETNKNLNPDATKIRVIQQNYCALLRSKIFLGYTLCACFACAGLVAYLTIAPFLFQNVLGLSPLEYGQLSIFIAGAICLSGIINSQLVMSKGVSYMLFMGVLLMIGGGGIMLSFALAGIMNVATIMIPIALFSMGAGFTFINAFAGVFHPFPQIAGTVAALYVSMQDLTSALTSGIIAVAKIQGQLSLALILLVLGLSALAAWYYQESIIQ
ncbi:MULTISPECIES: multidrug effflux MFS transporter [Legionella]|uniref:Bcr/CflA family efflux transporter n=1 Tax=Legionella resiliens TaxID=2905958 RepID=A0ABS8X8D8_9GAMM|nr:MULTISPECIES: multidrug effflux MFS transporter [unclassified Legionella]MCE0724720.1 multidrug effflux MFS transporter [Legionella sp. 9fVS26]MCE3533874.1 multidrug effflux MFS transporter [Legionella sp. 8cVS16]QLZ70108.1 Bcr/CflA family drug resistance efflux transporter [Legionella sp. PC1000]